jgi:hypothetical protein
LLPDSQRAFESEEPVLARSSPNKASQFNDQPIPPSAADQVVIGSAAHRGEIPAPPDIFQYSLRTLFIAVAVVALLCKLPDLWHGFWHGFYYHERIKIAELIEQSPEVHSAEYVGFDDDFTENIIVTTIELRDRPDATLRLCHLEDHENGSFRHLYVQQIGDLTFVVGGVYVSDQPNRTTGEPVTSQFWRCDVDIGPDSQLKDVLPFTVSTLDELIERYDELIAYFETWPTAGNRGTIRLPDGTERYYYHGRKQK